MLLNSAGMLGATLVNFQSASLLKTNLAVTALTLIMLSAFWTSLVFSKLASLITFTLLGFCCLPAIFVSYELGVQLACTGTGLGEATPVGMINMLANGLGAIQILAFTPILNG